MAIFDGHDGDACATFLQHELHAALAAHPDFHLNARRAVAEAFRQTDEAACEMLRSRDDASGATAVVALFDGRARRLLVARRVGNRPPVPPPPGNSSDSPRSLARIEFVFRGFSGPASARRRSPTTRRGASEDSFRSAPVGGLSRIGLIFF